MTFFTHSAPGNRGEGHSFDYWTIAKWRVHGFSHWKIMSWTLPWTNLISGISPLSNFMCSCLVWFRACRRGP
jgi:hypothetical protein